VFGRVTLKTKVHNLLVPAGLLDLELADVVVRLPPGVRERALVSGRTIDCVRGDEAEVLEDKRLLGFHVAFASYARRNARQ